jgi:hypothetical protein
LHCLTRSKKWFRAPCCVDRLCVRRDSSQREPHRVNRRAARARSTAPPHPQHVVEFALICSTRWGSALRRSPCDSTYSRARRSRCFVRSCFSIKTTQRAVRASSALIHPQHVVELAFRSRHKTELLSDGARSLALRRPPQVVAFGRKLARPQRRIGRKSVRPQKPITTCRDSGFHCAV